MIRITDLSHSLGNTKVLDGVNLLIPEGTVMGLVGINGAGKSTLLRLIAGVYTPEEGRIELDCFSPTDERGREGVFFLPDDPYFTHQTTMKSMLKMYSSLYPVDLELYRELVKEFGLNERKPIRTFSKGMRRQAYIAVALAIRPRILLLDEAFDGLDPLARHRVKNRLVELVEDGKSTVIISSHALRELEDFCDKYAVLDRMTVSSSGDISERVERYCKFMLAFVDGFEESMLRNLPVISMTASGKFVKVTFDGDAEEMEKRLRELSPTVMEQMPVDFEEVFINEVTKEERR